MRVQSPTPLRLRSRSRARFIEEPKSKSSEPKRRSPPRVSRSPSPAPIRMQPQTDACSFWMKLLTVTLALFSGAKLLLRNLPREPHSETGIGDGPGYSPLFWTPPFRQRRNNCYNYAVNRTTNTFAQPSSIQSPLTCDTVSAAAIRDGLRPLASPDENCPGHQVFMGANHNDFHWWRKDGPDFWTHKPGVQPPRSVDANGNSITNPLEADLGKYDPCGFFCVEDSKVTIR